MTRPDAQPGLFDTPTTPTKTPPTPMPTSALHAHLIRTGHTTETGLTRRARLRPCPRPTCPHWILTGLDDDTCALEARTDPTPITPLAEALTHITGRRTYTLRRQGPGYVLDPRTATDITHHPAGTQPRRDVLAEHHCPTPPYTGPLTAPSTFPETTPPLPPGSPAPF